MTEERRNHPRVEVSHPVRYVARIHPTPRLVRTVDLSLGGTRIETPHHLMTGQLVRLSIAVYPQVITCRGHVVHTLTMDGKKPMAGIQFVGMSRADRSYLGEHISHLLTQRNSRGDVN